MHVLPIDPLDRVTGSSYLVHIPEGDVRLLVDCGSYQDGRDVDILDDQPFPFEPSRLTAVLLTHAHYDHCGRLPRLVLAGFVGQVIATDETIEIAKIVLEDSARISRRKDHRKALKSIRWRSYDSHLFTRPLPIATDIWAAAHRSAHIVGAISVEIIAGPKERPSEQARVLFSGDIGNNFEGREAQPFLRHIMSPSRTIDLAVMESTYGSIQRPVEHFDPAARRARLVDAVRIGVTRGGTVVIPAFGVQRAQDVLWDLHVALAKDPTVFDDAPILVDAPMAVLLHPILLAAMNRDMASPTGKVRPTWLGKQLFRELELDPDAPADLGRARAAISRVFGDRPTWQPGTLPLRPAGNAALAERVCGQWWRLNVDLRRALVGQDGARIVLATSGMAEGGPVLEWLAAHLRDKRAAVVFTGHCGTGTLGADLGRIAQLAPDQRARLQQALLVHDGEVRACDVEAKILVLHGYSAHADQPGLVDWAFPRAKDGSIFAVARRLLITHGDADSRRALRAALIKRAAATGIETTVDLPAPNGPGINVRSGAAIPRAEILGAVASLAAEEFDVQAARLEVQRLREENRQLRAENQRLTAMLQNRRRH